MIRRRPNGHAQKGSAGRLGSRSVRLLALVVIMVAVAVSASACSNLVSQANDAEKAGDYKTAIALYRDRLKAEPDDLAALEGLAGDLYILGQLDAALPVQEKVVALDPKESQIRVELGFNYLNHSHDAAKAVAVLIQAADLEPTAKYLTFLAQAEIAAGDPAKAEVALRRAIAADKTYGHSYGVLLSLLEGQKRGSEAAELRAAAQKAGVTSVEVGDVR